MSIVAVLLGAFYPQELRVRAVDASCALHHQELPEAANFRCCISQPIAQVNLDPHEVSFQRRERHHRHERCSTGTNFQDNPRAIGVQPWLRHRV